MYLTKTFTDKHNDCKIQFIIGNATNIVNRLYKKYNTGMIYKEFIGGYMLTVSMNCYHIIIDSNHISYNVINHELFHAVMAITTDRNVFEEESRALLMGTISDCIYHFLKEKHIKIA